MKNYFLIIGLGSMGKRRIRNLQALGMENIVGYDIREDRRLETENQYSIETFDTIEKALEKFKIGVFIISLPPDIHYKYMKLAIKLNIPSFIEASVVDTELEFIIEEAKKHKVLLLPSCTLHFHPAIKRINEIVKNKGLGVITNLLYHSGQYLPDWHSYEDVKDFYVSNKATGGCREIVPFELTWLTLLFGFPKRVVGFHKNSGILKGAETIEDTYNLLLDYDPMILNLSVDVVSRHATRRLLINGDKKQLHWNWDENLIKIYSPELNSWEEIKYEIQDANSGYNKNITEQMYIEEIASFLGAINNEGSYPNSLEHDHKVLNLLYACENSDKENIVKAF